MAVAEKKKEGQVELKEYTEKVEQYLPYRFSQLEKETISSQLAQAISDKADAENKLKEVSTQIKADIAKHDANIISCATKVRQGFEYRQIYEEKLIKALKLLFTATDINALVDSFSKLALRDNRQFVSWALPWAISDPMMQDLITERHREFIKRLLQERNIPFEES